MQVFGDPEAAKYVHGVAVHWYLNSFFGPWVLDKVHQRYPDKFIFASEACAGATAKEADRVILGSWERAEQYAADILEDLNHWITGWMDWNLALNTEGGPNWAKNFVDSPIIVNSSAQEFYKQPMYYALGHFRYTHFSAFLRFQTKPPRTQSNRSSGGSCVRLGDEVSVSSADDVVRKNCPYPSSGGFRDAILKTSRHGKRPLDRRRHAGRTRISTFFYLTGSGGNDTLLLVIDPSKAYQEIFGFGGAFTDSAGINIKSLPANMQDDLLKSYFSNQGIGYTIGRIPIASCDFSVRTYTYDDTPGDLELTHFTLAPEDFDLKIPYLKKAMSLSSEPVWFFGSAWTSPAWMKTSNALNGSGVLIGEPGGPYYKSWAKYYVRFVQEYERQGVPLWALTAQNEPTVGFFPGFRWQALGFTAATQRDFIKLDLGPALQEAGYGPETLQLMILDDNRYVLPHWTDVVLGDPEAAKYVHGVAVHWYFDRIFGPSALDKVHERSPDKYLFATEACSGSLIKGQEVVLGSWERAEQYATDILEVRVPDLIHSVTHLLIIPLIIGGSTSSNCAKFLAIMITILFIIITILTANCMIMPDYLLPEIWKQEVAAERFFVFGVIFFT
ncbi:hypothetical protein HPB48_013097 [Haemaphysalis longicornis]|uniref:Glucosylceramidase n=1 Tax=Haemaphysalis longicornis TaxID=44386 RepID=A0A9J6G5E8_HAELO|nr:hypothetical protein HPB48_013097 [Haemaphysalis longicornis]